MRLHSDRNQAGDPSNELLRFALFLKDGGRSKATLTALPTRAWPGGEVTQPRGMAILPDLAGMLVNSARTSTSAVVWVRAIASSCCCTCGSFPPAERHSPGMPAQRAQMSPRSPPCARRRRSTYSAAPRQRLPAAAASTTLPPRRSPSASLRARHPPDAPPSRRLPPSGRRPPSPTPTASPSAHRRADFTFPIRRAPPFLMGWCGARRAGRGRQHHSAAPD